MKKVRELTTGDLLAGDGTLLLLWHSVCSSQDSVITFVRLKSNLFEQLEAALFESFSFRGKYCLSRSSGIDAAGLDGHDTVATVLQEVGGVEGDDTRLIRLGNISKDTVNHGDELTVFEGVTGILDDGDDVGTLLGEGKKITTTAR